MWDLNHFKKRTIFRWLCEFTVSWKNIEHFVKCAANVLYTTLFTLEKPEIDCFFVRGLSDFGKWHIFGSFLVNFAFCAKFTKPRVWYWNFAFRKAFLTSEGIFAIYTKFPVQWYHFHRPAEDKNLPPVRLNICRKSTHVSCGWFGGGSQADAAFQFMCSNQ